MGSMESPRSCGRAATHEVLEAPAVVDVGSERGMDCYDSF